MPFRFVGFLLFFGCLAVVEPAREAVSAEPLPKVLLKTTKGDIVVELYEDEAPNTVANFVSLVEKKFYNGLPFHRVIDGFMAQGGDPDRRGTGGPGYTIACECYQSNARKHQRGSLSMAHAGRDTGGSQFYITFGAPAHLNGRHTVFGQVVEGMAVVDKLQRTETNGIPNGSKPDEIIEARMLNKRSHPYEPKKGPPR